MDVKLIQYRIEHFSLKTLQMQDVGKKFSKENFGNVSSVLNMEFKSPVRQEDPPESIQDTPVPNQEIQTSNNSGFSYFLKRVRYRYHVDCFLIFRKKNGYICITK
jgi:hypothetical protein